MVLVKLKLTKFIALDLIRKFPTRFVGADRKILLTCCGPAVCNGTALEGRGLRYHVRSLSTRVLSLKLGCFGVRHVPVCTCNMTITTSTIALIRRMNELSDTVPSAKHIH